MTAALLFLFVCNPIVDALIGSFYLQFLANCTSRSDPEYLMS